MAKTRKNKHRRRQNKNILQKTSQKVMPKVKTGLENVGQQVTKGVTRSVPLLQQLTNKFISLFTRKNK